jgi:hypothetical protein
MSSLWWNARRNGLRTPRRGGNKMTTMDERAMATDVDVLIRPRKEWALLYKQKQLAKA